MKTNDYESMFVLDNNAATADFDATAAQVDEILEKHGMALVKKEKWDERKLAYEINGQRRATFYLVYSRGPAEGQVAIDEDLALCEVVLRHLTIRLDEPIDEHIEKRAKEREALAEDSRRNSLSGWGDRRKGGDRGGKKPAAKPAEGDAPKGDAPAGDAPKAAAAEAPAPTEKPAEAAPTDAAPAEAAPAEPAVKAEAPAAEGGESKDA